MKQIYTDVIQFRGTHYDFGYIQGEKIKDSLTVKNRENQWKVRKPRFNVEVAEVRDAIKRFTPGVWDELLGLQAALKWPLKRVLMEFGGYRLDNVRSGCSILTGDHFLIRNYDYHPKTYEGRYLLYQPTDQGILPARLFQTGYHTIQSHITQCNPGDTEITSISSWTTCHLTTVL